MHNCTVFIEHSVFSGVSSETSIQGAFYFDYDTTKKLDDASFQALLHNVSFICNDLKYPVSYLSNAAILFVDCVFQNNTQSAIWAYHARVIFESNNTFRNNSGIIGGGIVFQESSSLHLRPNTSILFEGNHAEYVGGAIYTDYKEENLCFFFIGSPTFDHTIKINFDNNTANFSGSSLYGGGIKPCAAFTAIFNISNTEADPSAVASDPYNVCFCADNKS